MMIKHNRDSDMAATEELFDKKIAVTPANILYSDSSRDTRYVRVHFALSEESLEKVVEILESD